MDSAALHEFNSVANAIIDDTRAGKLVWRKVNPTTFSWMGTMGHVLVQEVSQSRIQGGARRVLKGHLFQVLDRAQAPQLVVNSLQLPETREVLQELFDAVASRFTKQGVDFLRDLLSSREE